MLWAKTQLSCYTDGYGAPKSPLGRQDFGPKARFPDVARLSLKRAGFVVLVTGVRCCCYCVYDDVVFDGDVRVTMLVLGM